MVHLLTVFNIFNNYLLPSELYETTYILLNLFVTLS